MNEVSIFYLPVPRYIRRAQWRHAFVSAATVALAGLSVGMLGLSAKELIYGFRLSHDSQATIDFIVDRECTPNAVAKEKFSYYLSDWAGIDRKKLSELRLYLNEPRLSGGPSQPLVIFTGIARDINSRRKISFPYRHISKTCPRAFKYAPAVNN